jgi:hypothetical protein
VTFEWADLFRSLNPPTAVALGLAGLFIGRVVLRRWVVYPSHVLWFAFATGTVWATVLLVVRIGEGAAAWEAYLGALILWWVFCAAIDVGYVISRRHGTP